MSVGGWVMMTLFWALTLGLNLFCLYKLLTVRPSDVD